MTSNNPQRQQCLIVEINYKRKTSDKEIHWESLRTVFNQKLTRMLVAVKNENKMMKLTITTILAEYQLPQKRERNATNKEEETPNLRRTNYHRQRPQNDAAG